MKPLNMPFITERIKTAHDNFINAVGDIPSKITADHQLILQRMVTRIEAICKCFIEAGAIDSVKNAINKGDGDEHCVYFRLSKKGYDKSVYVWTDGRNITIKTAHYTYMSGLNLEDDIVIRDIKFDEYNWVEFSDKLLHFIHQVIYARTQSYEAKIFEE